MRPGNLVLGLLHTATGLRQRRPQVAKDFVGSALQQHSAAPPCAHSQRHVAVARLGGTQQHQHASSKAHKGHTSGSSALQWHQHPSSKAEAIALAIWGRKKIEQWTDQPNEVQQHAV